MITVAIVEDDKGIRQSLERLRESASEFSCVASCGSTEEAWRAGASGHVLKRAAPEQILQPIREVHAGGVPMSNEIARKVPGAFRESVPASASEAGSLSRREQEVLELLAQGCSNKGLAHKRSISIETVTWHLRHVYRKLHAHPRTQAALKFLSRQKSP